MSIRILKPTTSASRKTSYDDYSLITVKKPYKKLVTGFNRCKGRDDTGRVSVRHKGSGNKRLYRLVEFGNLTGKWVVKTIEYDPNRTAFIALIYQEEIKQYKYIIAPNGLNVDDELITNKTIQLGKRMSLADIPTGVSIYNIEIQPGSKGKMVRSAGTEAIITAKEGDYALIKLPSGEIRKFNIKCLASIGKVSNITHNTIRIGKAGRKRHMGIRPSVRGKAMAPNAHPHGGGEGLSPIGMKYPKTPWGKHALGVKTRKKHKYSNRLIVKRRK